VLQKLKDIFTIYKLSIVNGANTEVEDKSFCIQGRDVESYVTLSRDELIQLKTEIENILDNKMNLPLFTVKFGGGVPTSEHPLEQDCMLDFWGYYKKRKKYYIE
jgi:hypothetical protein